MSELSTKIYETFCENGTEYWTARELAPVLEYAKWENFAKVIDRAMLA